MSSSIEEVHFCELNMSKFIKDVSELTWNGVLLSLMAIRMVGFSHQKLNLCNDSVTLNGFYHMTSKCLKNATKVLT